MSTRSGVFTDSEAFDGWTEEAIELANQVMESLFGDSTAATSGVAPGLPALEIGDRGYEHRLLRVFCADGMEFWVIQSADPEISLVPVSPHLAAGAFLTLDDCSGVLLEREIFTRAGNRNLFYAGEQLACDEVPPLTPPAAPLNLSEGTVQQAVNSENPGPGLTCVICHGGAVEYAAVVCGHLFCSECADRMISLNLRVCPMCRREIMLFFKIFG